MYLEIKNINGVVTVTKHENGTKELIATLNNKDAVEIFINTSIALNTEKRVIG